MRSVSVHDLGYFEGERKRIEAQLAREDDAAPIWASVPVALAVYGALAYALLAAFLPELPA